MNIYIRCSECLRLSENPTDPQDFQFYKVFVNEEGVYNFICYKGHETTAISVYDKYQILFQMAANALLNGYYFEAVGCFIASVERFRDWVIRFIWYLNGIDENITEELWKKQLKNSSERQLGAFSSMFINHFKEAPPIFDDKQNKFRNSVLHKGMIPTKDESHKFGEYVFNYIRSIQKTIFTQYNSESFEFSSKVLKKRFSKFETSQLMNGEVVLQNASEMIMLLGYSVVRSTSFQDEIEILKDYINTYDLHGIKYKK
ncbi:hypothetical protein [Bacillus safensis]|uniref:hypothetical protein n=1 Tax=Bacillus safensis TaxID=561879 RepID=UPI001931798E|nr:hypothetical protein [Bacillus safensis]QRF32898.1 hypothetical protein JNE45_03120 [Bacillus safensis]